MAKITFDIKYRPEIESGKYKVVTRDGRDIRIVCWNAIGECPIVGLVKNIADDETYYEMPIRYGEDGIVGNDKLDLFIITDEPELTEFEKAYLKSKHHFDPEDINPEFLTTNKVREYAKELLAVARKQLQPEIDAEIEKAYKNTDKVQYEKGRQDLLNELYCGNEEFKDAVSEKIRNMVNKLFNGKNDITSKRFADEFAWDLLMLARAETFKDIPNWQITEEGEQYNLCLTRWLDVNGDYQYELSHGHLAAGMEYLPISKLAKLKIER